MPKPRQKSIGITPAEKMYLNTYKTKYEQATGEICDWGKFLTAASRLAMVAVDMGYRVTITEAIERKCHKP